VELLIEERASDRLDDLPPEARLAMLERLKRIAADPFGRHSNVKPLAGQQGLFRLRQGAWRAVYFVDRDRHQVRVVRIAPRSEAYR
jgi:mRNA-degrading endonuclease RelE of RelBE toxin-antitoxin system